MTMGFKMTLALLFFAGAPLAAKAESFEYRCYSYFWNGHEHEHGTMSLSVDDTSASADIAEVAWDKDLGGDLVEGYRPRGARKFLKFGRALFLEAILADGGRKLSDGTFGGIARVEGEAEGGFYQYKFICKR